MGLCSPYDLLGPMPNLGDDSLRRSWIEGTFSLLHQRLIDHVQAGRADEAFAATLALCLHVRRYADLA